MGGGGRQGEAPCTCFSLDLRVVAVVDTIDCSAVQRSRRTRVPMIFNPDLRVVAV